MMNAAVMNDELVVSRQHLVGSAARSPARASPPPAGEGFYTDYWILSTDYFSSFITHHCRIHHFQVIYE
jgi:hypothetical protein